MDFPHVVLARLYEHIEPIDRGDRYEDPLRRCSSAPTSVVSPVAAHN
jgi:hypothetical protein